MLKKTLLVSKKQNKQTNKKKPIQFKTKLYF